MRPPSPCPPPPMITSSEAYYESLTYYESSGPSAHTPAGPFETEEEAVEEFWSSPSGGPPTPATPRQSPPKCRPTYSP